ncbi:MAG TPA: LCP family protein [Armatimonadota bacterium]|nr:LCP family protein [Armatimonadota bacterium]
MRRRDSGGAKLVLAIILFIAACIGGGALIGLYTSDFGHTIRTQLAPPFGGRDTVVILVLGEDDTSRTDKKPRGLSDTIILMRADLLNKQVAVLSIPRDTRVRLEGYGDHCKINASHVYGGPTLTAIAVQGLVGIKPDYYIKTNHEGLRKCVDILGGVEIDVEKNMRYNDNWGHLHINLKKGRQLLNGEQAMGYVRFRHDALGDLSRIERQQKFLKALTDKALSPINLPKLPKLMNAMMQNVDTDMTARDLLALAKLAESMDRSTVRMGMLPGVPETIGGISYWIADTEQSAKVINALFFPRPPMPKVAVLNGSGIPGAGQKAAETLKQQGYEVTSVENAESFDHTTTEVIGHRESEDSSYKIAALLNGVVKQEKDPAAKADVTVIVGKNYIAPSSGT